VRRLLTGLIVLGVCAAAVLLAGAGGRKGGEREYKIVFDNAFGLTEGGDFRVGGVKAGKTTGFDVTPETKARGSKAVVTAKITQPGFGDFRKDASCTIKPQSLIGEYYVECQPGSSREKLPNGGTVPVEHTESTIPQDLVNNILRRPYRERLRLIITELGTGLAGRPKDLAEVLRRAHPGLRETSKVLRILGDQNRIIEDFITDSDTVIRELERNKKDVARWVTEAGNAAEATASRRRELAETVHKLPRFLDELRPTMARLGQLTDEQTPLLADLQRAAPDLNVFLTRLQPFAEVSRPALRSLGAASAVGRKAFDEGTQEVAELKRLARDAPAAAKPLRQFLETLDERDRAVDGPDPRAEQGAPPAPDKTHAGAGRGFTGMESLWNYFFWQTLSLNGYDSISHVLRASLTINKCSNFFNEVDYQQNQEMFKDCAHGWLGPRQPGIMTDDFTADGAARTAAAEGGKPATRLGERREAGQPDAGPLPGQRDISKPQVTLPPAVDNLLDHLQDDLPKAPNVPEVKQKLQDTLDQTGVGGATGTTDEQLLDFLLGP
jgi:ABC-type transporter Mla subunit MlaD